MSDSQEHSGGEGLLTDGSEPATAQDLLARLDELGIAATSYEHPAVHTVEQAKALRGELAGAHIKKLIWSPDFVSESVSGIHHCFLPWRVCNLHVSLKGETL
jgi:hypothetical protein